VGAGHVPVVSRSTPTSGVVERIVSVRVPPHKQSINKAGISADGELQKCAHRVYASSGLAAPTQTHRLGDDISMLTYSYRQTAAYCLPSRLTQRIMLKEDPAMPEVPNTESHNHDELEYQLPASGQPPVLNAAIPKPYNADYMNDYFKKTDDRDSAHEGNNADAAKKMMTSDDEMSDDYLPARECFSEPEFAVTGFQPMSCRSQLAADARKAGMADAALGSESNVFRLAEQFESFTRASQKSNVTLRMTASPAVAGNSVLEPVATKSQVPYHSHLTHLAHIDSDDPDCESPSPPWASARAQSCTDMTLTLPNVPSGPLQQTSADTPTVSSPTTQLRACLGGLCHHCL
jgi:hypothetical protein